MELASYYLLRDEISLEEAIDHIASLGTNTKPKYDFAGDTHLVSIDDEVTILRGSCFVFQQPTSAPKWYGLIEHLVVDTLPTRFPTSSHSGIILCECSNRIWAIAFGHSYRDVEELPVETRFGRITISNAIDNIEALRGFASQTFGRDAKVRIETTARDGPIDRLSFLEQSNRLRKLRARVNLGEDEFLVEGGISFRFPRAENGDQLVLFLLQMFEWWNGGKELNDEIAEKDPLFELPRAQHPEYDAQYESALRGESNAGFFINMDIEEYWNASAYRLKLGKEEVAQIAMPDTDILIGQIRKFLDIEAGSKFELRLEIELPSGIQSRPIRSIISFERPQQTGEPFILVRDDGTWWEYRQSWVKKVNQSLKFYFGPNLAFSKELQDRFVSFKRSLLGNDPEGEWMDQLVTAISGSAKLHVISNIKIDQAKSPFELADLFIPPNILLAIKRGDDLKRIDEVASQAENAARMLSRYPEYTSKAMELFAKIGVPLDLNERANIHFGCVTIAEKPPTSIRAKERIVQFHRTMIDFNFKPFWLFIKANP